MNEATKTIPGNYHVVVLPDGQLVALSKLNNGEWALTQDRVKETVKSESAVAFDKRFENTKTIPADFVQKDTDTLTLDIDKVKENLEGPRKRLDAYFGEILGNPDDIISGKIAIPNEKQLARHKEHIVGLMESLNSPKWNKVRELIWK